MTYTFEGFFAATEETLLPTVFERWPECDGKIILHPFKGIGVSCNKLYGKAQAIKSELPALRQLFPTVDFVWIEVECFGGLCDYSGTVYRNNQVMFFTAWPEDIGESEDNLRQLLTYLGVNRESILFEPFQRGYFRNT